MVRAFPCLAVAYFLCGLPSDAQEPIHLKPGDVVEREISNGQAHSFRIEARTDQFIGVTVWQHGIDLDERLFPPDGQPPVSFHGDKRLEESEVADFVAAFAGSYRLEVKPLVRTAAGRYQIRFREVRPANAHDRRLFEARTLLSRGVTFQAAGEYRRALPLARRALEIADAELGPRDDYAGLVLIDLAAAVDRTGGLEEAEKLAQRAREVTQNSLGGDHPRMAAVLRLLGDFAAERGESARAEELLQKSLALGEQTLGGAHPSLVQTLLALSSFHQGRGDLALAEQELKRAVSIVSGHLAPNDLLADKPLNNLAVLYNSQKAYDTAEPLLQRAVEIVEKNLGADSIQLALPLQNLGLIAQEKAKDYPRALALYSRAAGLLEKAGGPENPQILPILNNMANIYRSSGEYAKSVELLERVHTMAGKQSGPYASLTMISLGNIARTYAAAGDAENALKYQAQTDELIEKQLVLNLAIGSERQKLAYFDSLAERTSRTISLQAGLAAQSPDAARLAALVVMQRKGRVLDAMSGSFAALRQRLNAEDQNLFDELNSSAAQFARLALGGRGKLAADEYAQRLNTIEAHKEQVEAEISRRSAEFRAQTQTVTVEAVRKAIPARAALIEFAAYRPFNPKLNNNEAYGEPRYMSYVLRRDSDVKWQDLGAAKPIDDAVEAFRSAARDPHRSDVETLARALERKIMQPLRPLVGDAAQLLISPDGPLNLIPFQALLDEQGRYLVERYSITYLTSGRDLLRLQTPRDAKSPPLLIANPLFGEPQAEQNNRGSSSVYFAPLTGTELEARAIQSRFPDATVLSGKQATESALAQVLAPRILHIATHGFFVRANQTPAVTDNPLLHSGLALAGANLSKGVAGDGIFTALEASGLNLWGTRLVTLSACDTGLGEVKNGDGVYGLRRAFFLAGTESLVMSLWPVSDYMTLRTMISYYTGLREGLGRGEALRQAQLAMIRQKDRRHPFYWAGFIQSGEWKNLDGK